MWSDAGMPQSRMVTVTLNPAVDRVIEAPGFKVGQRVTGRVVAWYPTGKGITISRVLGAVGVRSIATGFVGRGELGMFEERLDRVGDGRIVNQFLIVRARTRDNVTIIDPIDDTESSVRDEGFIVQPDDVKRIASKLAMLARADTVMCFAGSLPGGVEPEQFGRMVGRCAAQGARIVIDVSDEALRGLGGRGGWMLRVNRRQLEQVSGMPVETEREIIEAARSMTMAAGGRFDVVVATRGADGAVLATGEHMWIGRVSVHPGRIVATVGSGESMVAGILSVAIRDGTWEEALREGLALATANAIGREAGQIDMLDVEEFRGMAMVEAGAGART